MLLMKKRTPSLIVPAFSILILISISCRPVITVGWQEIGILALLLAVLIGPAIYRVFRRFDEFKQWKAKRDKDHPKF